MDSSVHSIPWLKIQQESSGDEALIVSLVKEHVLSVATLESMWSQCASTKWYRKYMQFSGVKVLAGLQILHRVQCIMKQCGSLDLQ